jgi:hypothetical protein
MNAVKYREKKDGITVLVDGVVVGHIRQLAYNLGWVYAPKGSALRSDKFKSLAALKKSIETEIPQ